MFRVQELVQLFHVAKLAPRDLPKLPERLPFSFDPGAEHVSLQTRFHGMVFDVQIGVCGAALRPNSLENFYPWINFSYAEKSSKGNDSRSKWGLHLFFKHKEISIESGPWYAREKTASKIALARPMCQSLVTTTMRVNLPGSM